MDDFFSWLGPAFSVALFFAGLAAVVLAWLAGPALWRTWRRARIRRQPFPGAWREVLRRRMPAYARLPPHLQMQLKKHVQVLLAEKPFIGCAGLVVIATNWSVLKLLS